MKISRKLVLLTAFLPALVSVSKAQSPYTLTTIPGTIEAEYYDYGGQGVAFNDKDWTNMGGQLRYSDGVDIEKCSNGTNNYNLGWIETGEWTKYSIKSIKDGYYNVTFRVAGVNVIPGSSITASLSSGGSIVVYPSSTGGWQNWQDITVYGVGLWELHDVVLKLTFNGGNFNLDNIKVEQTSGNQIINGSFAFGSDGLEGWDKYISPVTGNSSITVGYGSANATIQYGTNYNTWDVQLSQKNLKLLKNKVYELKFDVRANGHDLNGSIVADIQNASNYTTYKSQTFYFGPNFTTCKYIVEDVEDNNVRVSFNMAGFVSSWGSTILSIDNVSFIDIRTKSGVEKFEEIAIEEVVPGAQVEASTSVGVEVMPNPASDVVTISGLSSDAKVVSLVDVLGNEVLSQGISSSEVIFNVASISKGIYKVVVDGVSVTSVAKN